MQQQVWRRSFTKHPHTVAAARGAGAPGQPPARAASPQLPPSHPVPPSPARTPPACGMPPLSGHNPQKTRLCLPAEGHSALSRAKHTIRSQFLASRQFWSWRRTCHGLLSCWAVSYEQGFAGPVCHTASPGRALTCWARSACAHACCACCAASAASLCSAVTRASRASFSAIRPSSCGTNSFSSLT